MLRSQKTRIVRSLGVLALLFAGLAAGPASAGVVFEVETKEYSPAKTTAMEIWAEGTNLKMQIPAANQGKDGEMIYRGDRKEMLVVDGSQETYMVIDEAAIQKIGAVAGQVMQQMEEALKNVPEDRRAMVEQMMKDQMGQAGAPSQSPRIEVRTTNEKATKNGYPCVRYNVYEGDQKVRDIWVTDWKNIDGATEARTAFEDMAGFFQKLIDSLPRGNGMFSSSGAGNTMMATMKELDGFPVVGFELDEDGSVTGEFSLKSSKRQAMEPSAFEPPAGYKRQAMPGGM